MTCIVGVVDGDRVVMGGDSAATNWRLDSLAVLSPKVVRVGEFVIGICGSARMGQILHHDFTPPRRHADTDALAYMIKEFIGAVRAAFNGAGWGWSDRGRESGGDFLVGFAGRLFHVQDDFSVLESRDGFLAIGCGGAVALGSLCETKDRPGEERVRRALEASEHLSGGVRGPFHIEAVGGTAKPTSQAA